MASALAVKARRAVLAAPFLLVAAWCFRTMDIDKIVANQQPFSDSGVIAWEGGRIEILDRFHGVGLLDRLWRGSMATFAPSTLGYDAASSWQMFSFLVDLGPVYAVWILESSRPASAWTPAYFPTLFSFAGQLLGLGSVAPVFYFLCFAFGPTASDLAAQPQRAGGVNPWKARASSLLLPLVLGFHTCEVLAMFLAPELTTRHFWTWAWQLTPFWIGIANFLFSIVSRNSAISARPLVMTLGLLSGVVWVYTMLYSPHSMSTLFIPVQEEQSDYIGHSRKAFQADEIGVFGSTFLWMLYSFFDLRSVGVLGDDWLYKIALLPVIFAVAGPGATLLAGWHFREKALASRFREGYGHKY